MTDDITFFVPGRPFSKKRPRFGRGRTYTDPETVAAEAAVRWYAKRALPEKFKPFEGPVRLSCIFRFAVTDSWSARRKIEMTGQFHAFKPDVDNLEKLVMDALNPPRPRDHDQLWTGVWLDDSQVGAKVTVKRWADESNPEGTTVLVSRIR